MDYYTKGFNLMTASLNEMSDSSSGAPAPAIGRAVIGALRSASQAAVAVHLAATALESALAAAQEDHDRGVKFLFKNLINPVMERVGGPVAVAVLRCCCFPSLRPKLLAADRKGKFDPAAVASFLAALDEQLVEKLGVNAQDLAAAPELVGGQQLARLRASIAAVEEALPLLPSLRETYLQGYNAAYRVSLVLINTAEAKLIGKAAPFLQQSNPTAAASAGAAGGLGGGSTTSTVAVTGRKLSAASATATMASATATETSMATATETSMVTETSTASETSTATATSVAAAPMATERPAKPALSAAAAAAAFAASGAAAAAAARNAATTTSAPLFDAFDAADDDVARSFQQVDRHLLLSMITAYAGMANTAAPRIRALQMAFHGAIERHDARAQRDASMLESLRKLATRGCCRGRSTALAALADILAAYDRSVEVELGKAADANTPGGPTIRERARKATRRATRAATRTAVEAAARASAAIRPDNKRQKPNNTNGADGGNEDNDDDDDDDSTTTTTITTTTTNNADDGVGRDESRF